MKLYLNENPRTFFITSNNHVLILRHPFPQYKNGSSHQHAKNADGDGSKSGSGNQLSNDVIVEFMSMDTVDPTKYRDITPTITRQNKQFLGFLGLLNVKSNIYLGFVTREVSIASPKTGEMVKKITEVDFYCLNNDEYDYLLNRTFQDENLTSPSLAYPQIHHHHNPQEKERGHTPASSVKKLLSLGTFFYSRDFDICSNIQERGFNKPQGFLLVADLPYFKRFLWNGYMNSEIIEFRNRLSPKERFQFDKCGFLVTITRGYAKTVNTTVGDEEAMLSLISKQSCIKSGPLFGCWGCDDNGAVSNFVETEIIVYTEKYCFSYIIIRGNVPIHWELENHFSKSKIISKKHKTVVFSRSFEASQHAFTRHFDRLVNQFGDVHIIDSLSQDYKSYKGQLNVKFKEHIEYFNRKKKEVAKYNEELGALTSYKLLSTDMPISTSVMKKLGYTAAQPYDLIPLLVDSVIDYSATFYDCGKKSFTGKQLGVFRVTSFDSLDKANFISKVITQLVIELAFRDIGIQVNHELFTKHAKLWEENEEFISKITINFVSNSAKLQASSTASKNLSSLLPKKYLSGVVDTKPNETAMLKLLGRLQDQESISLHNPMHSYVMHELEKRSKEFSSAKDISIFAGTFNVNGSCYNGSIKEWLFPHLKDIAEAYELVVIGIQEIVELNATQMVNTDSANRYFWEEKLRNSLNELNMSGKRYASLWTGQIGGIALFLFVQEQELENISNVEGSYKKTGLGGMSANKGGVAVRFTYSNTELCFISSHLAAGLSNVDERHQNYKTLVKGLKFSKNRRIKDHDAVIWLGDFNFRIDLPNELVKELIERKDFAKLFESDQLNVQMAKGETFPFFDEMEIQFPPTYKFDNGTQTYDTSEKQRIPAWTDRILSLSRNKILKQILYNSAPEVVFSDHRPVYGIFMCSVNIVNENMKERLLNGLYESYRKTFGNDIFFTKQNLSFLLNNNKALPAPSSEIHKWWLEGGKAAKIDIPKLNKTEGESYVINPKLPANPFEVTDQPEFLSKSSLLKL
ncbi:uncharacterized protein PRCAT00005474001 [Priceomyces carsonii]|uniref:uncharacterized protein n=1 Tax=Priceomyces carsonii TaxID=28549 RepID=UPI002ED8B1EC|nr:unnamed protein product [Priceomyces carsonii]